MSANTQIVMDCFEAWHAKDLDKVMSFFTPDAVYHCIPMDPAKGIDGIRAFAEGVFKMANQLKVDTLHIAETQEGVVLTERIDHTQIEETWIPLPVMGAFEITDGKISAWRDYFDVEQFQKQMPSSG
jgi:limonene-1,2-epoxide hydrolase